MEIINNPKIRGNDRKQALEEFAQSLIKIDEEMEFRVSSRGWCYELEGYEIINKGQFDRAQDLINECRAKGLIPIDFVADDDERGFSGILYPDTLNQIPTPEEAGEYIKDIVEWANTCETSYTPNYYNGEKFYIQMIVEKKDLVPLFKPVCEDYNIPIATSKGWSSMIMRADYAGRFQKYEQVDLKPVLLYCGDHDPAGLQISDTLRKNLEQIQHTWWRDGHTGYDPKKLIIDRFGLNCDFIEKHSLTWINGLMTGSGKDLANPHHKDHYKKYVQDYLQEYGPRKVEANALLKIKDEARKLCRAAIEKYLGGDAVSRFSKIRKERNKVFKKFRNDTGLDNAIEEVLRSLSH